MEHKRLVTTLLITVYVSVCAWIACLPVPVTQANGQRLGSTKTEQTDANWQQVNNNGFGTAQASEISAVGAFDGYLYAGTDNAADGAQILRSSDGISWTAVSAPGFGIPHDTAPHAILDLATFNGRIYASTGRSQNAGQIWRSVNGLNWAPMIIAGFGDPDTVDVSALAVYNGQIYAGATNRVTGAQIWRSFTGDSNSWEQSVPAISGTEPAAVTGFAEFDGALYAAIESAEAPAQIWYSLGGDWMSAVADGFGDSNTNKTGGMAVLNGYLYVGAGNALQGAQLWRTNDGENWQQVITPGFGDANNQEIDALTVFENALYVSVQNPVTGVEIWRSQNGTVWQQANLDGFGDSKNTLANIVDPHLGNLYVGTRNQIDGGELWRLSSGVFYGLDLSPDASLSGQAGQRVAYTVILTNTGNTTDTYSLSLAGNVWPTTLSSSTETLLPTTTAHFTVTVDIPAGTSVNASDTVTVTAISQGAEGLSDAAVLTTHSTSPLHKIYLPTVINNAMKNMLYLPQIISGVSAQRRIADE